MSASTPTARSKQPKPSPSSDIVEIQPPAGLGFSGTAKFDVHDPEAMKIVAHLTTHLGYTIVTPT